MCVKNKKILYSILVLLWIGVSVRAQKPDYQKQFVEGVFMVKLKPEKRSFFVTRNYNQKWMNIGRKYTVLPAFRNALQLTNKELSSTQKVDLNLIYTISSTKTQSIKQVVEELESLGIFEYVEPKRIRHIDFTPNDSEIGQQYYLAQVNAYSAWDVNHGNVAFKIGIVDTGTEMDHPDLTTKMAENSADPVNGIDDDGDGYIDNFYGWDFMENDNTPEVGDSPHGIHVAGIAAAATNNNEGVSGVGFDTQFMPIRVANGSAVIYGYEGIVYAADMGCDIINCSWGGFGYSMFEEDIINYATYNKDALVVCAAGNSNQDQEYYPAAYENALAVSSINFLDNKSSFTNHGYWVDLAATGEGIYSTWTDGGYNKNTGTSMATPVVSGAAALVKTRYPQFSALQIKERLKLTSFDIDNINPGYENKLGVGRLDIGDAVTGAILDGSVVFGNIKITNGYDDIFKVGDSLHISGTFTNYMAQSNNVTATITPLSASVTANHTTENLGVMAALLQKDNYSHPFSFKITNTTGVNEKVVFKIVITDGVFTNISFIEVRINVDYLHLAVNNVWTTVGSKGQFGYNDRSQRIGYGMTLNNGLSQLYEAGLMVGTNTQGYPQVVDRVRNAPGVFDDDFASIQNVKKITPAPKGDYFIQGVFNDSNANFDSIGVQISHTGYASTDNGHANYFVLEYTVVNTSSTDITDLSIGLFVDFDIANYENNQAHTDWIRFMTYTENTTQNVPVFGVQLLTPGVFRSYCFDLIPGGGGGGDITNNFTSNSKYQSMNINRYQAGVGSSTGNDVAQVTSFSGVNLVAGDSVTVAFAMHAANNVVLLQNSADSAYFRYNGALPNSVEELGLNNSKLRIYPNPTQNQVTIDVSELEEQGDWSFKIVDVTSKVSYVSALIKGTKTFVLDTQTMNSGVYFVEIQVADKVFVTKLIKNP